MAKLLSKSFKFLSGKGAYPFPVVIGSLYSELLLTCIITPLLLHETSVIPCSGTIQLPHVIIEKGGQVPAVYAFLALAPFKCVVLLD